MNQLQMKFSDERINSLCGKIYRNGIILSVLITAVYLPILRYGYNFTEAAQFSNIFDELAIIAAGLGILLIGIAKFRTQKQDERIAASEHRYYLNAWKVFLCVILGSYALSLPYVLESDAKQSVPNNYLLLILQTVGLIYLYFKFRQHKININYTVISESKKVYFLHILKNIGYFALILLLPYAFAVIISCIISKGFNNALIILLSYCASVWGLGLEYLFLSWVEKCFYDDERPLIFKKGVGILFSSVLLVVFTRGLLGVFQAIATSEAFRDILLSMNIEWGEFLASVSNITAHISNFIFAPLGIILWLSMMCCFDDIKIKKLMKCKVILSLIELVWSTLLFTVIRAVLNHFRGGASFEDTLEFELLISDISIMASHIFGFAELILAFALVNTLIKQSGIKKNLFTAPVLLCISYVMTFQSVANLSRDFFTWLNVNIPTIAHGAMMILSIGMPAIFNIKPSSLDGTVFTALLLMWLNIGCLLVYFIAFRKFDKKQQEKN